MLIDRYRDAILRFMVALFIGGAIPAFGGSVTEDEVRQNLRYAETVINSSAASKRVLASDHAEAKSTYRAAQEKMQQANGAYAAGRLDEAARASAEAMQLMSRAAQLVPSESARQMARTRNEKMLQGIDTLLASYQAAIGQPGAQAAPGLDLRAVEASKQRARALASDGDYDGSNRLLDRVMNDVSTALNELHGKNTLSYEMTFASPAEEYAYEVERYISLEQGVPLALEQMHPAQADIDKAGEYLKQAKARRQQADALAQQGNHEAALQQIRDASMQMETALFTLGVTY